MIAGKDNSGGVGNVFGTYEMTAEKQPEGCAGFYFEIETMPGAVVDGDSCFGIARKNGSMSKDSAHKGGKSSYLLDLSNGSKYANSGEVSHIEGYTSASNK